MKKVVLTLVVALFGFAAQAQEQPTDGAQINFEQKVILVNNRYTNFKEALTIWSITVVPLDINRYGGGRKGP